MASKLTLIDISSGFKGTDIQTNFTSIEDEFDDTLSRSGKSPNTMNAELDMNSNKIRNLAQAANNSDAATLKDVLDQTTEDATNKPATAITVSDSAEHYLGTNVEAVLEEVGDFQALFPNVDGEVTATDEDMNNVLTPYDTQSVELGGDFDAGETVTFTRIGNVVTATSDGALSHASGTTALSVLGAVPSQFTPDDTISFFGQANSTQFSWGRITSGAFPQVVVFHQDWSGSDTNETSVRFTISYHVS